MDHGSLQADQQFTMCLRGLPSRHAQSDLKGCILLLWVHSKQHL